MFFDPLEQRGIEVIMLIGNHDVFYKNTNDVNSVSLMLNEYKNITIINSPTTMNIAGTDICFIPWICDDNREACFEEIRNTRASVCAGHLEIAGFSMYPGAPSFDGLDRTIFQKFSKTFSGHYHHKSSSDNITYLGNPYELTWMDHDDPRGFHLFDTETYDLEFVQNTNIMFHRVIYDDKKETISQIMNKNMPYANNYVKVVVLNKSNPMLFDKFMNNLYNINPVDITVVEDFTDYSEGIDEDMVDQSESTINIINKYVDNMKVQGIDNTKFKSLLQEIYVESLYQEHA